MTQDNSTQSVKTCDAPSVAVLAIGGCGINLTREIIKTSHNLISYANYIDSSTANERDGEQVYVIGSGHGGGKLRTTNLDAFRQHIPKLGDDVVGDCDVYILVSSLAGATGGVATPLFAQELLHRGKKVILAIVGETIDELGTKNTHNALKTIMTLVNKTEAYLPTVITHTDRNRAEADKYMVRQVVALISVLRLPVYEIDKTDRLNWLDASKTVGLEPGLHMAYGLADGYETSEIEDLHDEHMIADSVLNLGVKSEDGARTYVDLPTKHARFAKDGLLATGRIPVSGVIVQASSTLDSIIKEIETKNHFFEKRGATSGKSLWSKLQDDEVGESFL